MDGSRPRPFCRLPLSSAFVFCACCAGEERPRVWWGEVDVCYALLCYALFCFLPSSTHQLAYTARKHEFKNGSDTSADSACCLPKLRRLEIGAQSSRVVSCWADSQSVTGQIEHKQRETSYASNLMPYLQACYAFFFFRSSVLLGLLRFFCFFVLFYPLLATFGNGL